VSANSWVTCPRCKAEGNIGFRGNQFREDWELGLNDPDAWGEGEAGQPPAVILKYSGECQDCGLEIKINQRVPLEDWTVPWEDWTVPWGDVQ